MNRDVEASKLFLQAERGNGSGDKEQPTTSANTGSTSPVQELMKCFCGICETWFQRKSLEYALMANGDEILRDDESRNILKKFIIYQKGGSNFKTPLEEIVDCFELAQDILNGEKDLEENRADLDDMLYTEYSEDNLTRAIEDGTTNDFFYDLIRKSAIRLELDSDFLLFKEELIKKLNIKK